MNSEPFPEYVEPTLATEEELDEIFNAQAQRPLTQQAVGVEELYQTGLMDVLPEFLSQLARIDLEAKSLLEINPQRSPQHVVAALMAQRQYCEFQTCSDDDEYATEASESVYSQAVSETCDDNDGNESDATTSTMASLRARTLKRKAAAEPDDVARPPNKVRIHVPKVPCQTIYYFDMKRGKLVSRPNPAAQTPDNNSDDLAVRPSSPNHIPPTSSSPTSSPESSFPSSPRQTPSPEFNRYPDWPAIPREVPRKRGRVIIRIKRTTSGSSRASSRESPRGEKIITFHVARRPCYSQPTSSPPSSGPNTVLSRVASPPALSYPPVPSPPRIVVKPRSRTPPRMDSISTMTDEFSDSVGGVSIVVSRRNSEFDNFEREDYAALTVPDRSGSVSSSFASAPELSSHGDGRSTKRRCVRIRVVQHGGMRQKAASSPAG